MAGAGPAPSPNARRPNAERGSAGFQWTLLPREGRTEPPPSLPPGTWSKAAKDAWADIWRMPQAVAWDQTGRTLHHWLLCWARVHSKDAPSIAPLLAEMRQIEDRHGFSPKAMLQLRWRIVDDEVADRRPVRLPGESARERLRAVVAEG